MSVETIGEVAEKYFNSLNPIAERISNDIDSIKDAYEDLWQCLSTRERDQIINETVIYPEAVLKYALGLKTLETPRLNNEHATGAKYIVDEHTGATWRDEHSAPFSWKTPSQIDLTIFGTSGDSKANSPLQPTSLIHNKNNINRNLFLENGRIEKLTGLKFDQGACNNQEISQGNDKIDGWGKKIVYEKSQSKKAFESPESPNVVLGGTCSKISGLCSKLKFLPGKTSSYEVKTVVSLAPNQNEGNFIEKIKANTVLKIQNTIRLVGGKNFISSEKKSVMDSGETENLVQPKPVVTITSTQKPSPKVAKPKGPPPPPPTLKPIPLAKSEDDDLDKETLNLIIVKNNRNEKSQAQNDVEKIALLKDSYMEVSTNFTSRRKTSNNETDPVITSPPGPSGDDIPKSGFDFLDNW